MEDFKIITIATMHEEIINFVKDKKIIISDYDDMKECVLLMIRSKYIFNLSRDRLRDAMEDLTYIYSPDDELNKDRVSKGLEYDYSDDEDDEDDEEDDDFDMMTLLKTMSQMRGPSQVGKTCPKQENEKTDVVEEVGEKVEEVGEKVEEVGEKVEEVAEKVEGVVGGAE